MNPIYYLCNSDIPEINGFLFPTELLEGTYTTGIWVIDLIYYERISDSYEFDAVDNDELVNLKMSRINGNIFQVDTSKYGKFYFRIVNLFYPRLKYVGKSKFIDSESRLLQVVSMDLHKLEITCMKHRFFFVGKVDRNLEKRIK